MGNVFEEIVKGKIPCNKVFENERILAFRDIAPQAPVHIIIIPKKGFENLAAAKPEHQQILGEMLLVAQNIAKKEGLSDYRVIANNGPDAGQSIFHFHLHLLGGRPLGILG